MTTFAQMTPPYAVEIVDISAYQDYNAHNQFVGIDFQRAKATRASLRGMLVKCGEGTINYPREVFLRQAREAHDFGFGVLPYHYWHYEAGADEQAGYFLERVRELPFRPGRVCVDVEDVDQAVCRPPDHVLAPEEYPDTIIRAVKTMRALRQYVYAVREAFGTLPVVYTAAWYFDWLVLFARMGAGEWREDLSWLGELDFWMASYTSPNMALPEGVDFLQVCMWQWTSTPPARFQVDGFPWPERLDMNFWLWPEEAFNRMFGVVEPPVDPPGGDLAALEARVARLEAWAGGFGG